MTIYIMGEQDRHRLDFAARNIYTFPNEEYRVIPSSREDGSYVLEINTIRRIEPILRVTVRDDLLQASVSFYPGINADKKISVQEVILHLVETNKINPMYVNEDAIKDAVHHLAEGYIVENVVVAKGEAPVHGKNAVIEYLFERPNTKPKLLPNGRVDYREFSKFILIAKDALIIRRTPPSSGKDGRDIRGEIIKAVHGEDKTVEVVDGVYANVEKTEYRAKYNGHIIFSGNMISVLPMLQIDGSVDMKVGNLRFEGTIHILEDVKSGFVIEADDIIVDGIVENAELKAKGSINIKRGIKGVLEKGSVRAGGNVSLGFCENANILSGGEVSIEKYCFNSIIQANSVKATGKNAIISGGEIRAFSHIRVTNLGSKNSGKMEVFLGFSPILQDKAEKVRVEMEQIKDSLDKIRVVLSKLNLKLQSVRDNPKVKMLLDSERAFKNRLPLLEKKYNDFHSKAVHKEPVVAIEDRVYSGVEINILNTLRVIKTEMNHVEFYLDTNKHAINHRNFRSEPENKQ